MPSAMMTTTAATRFSKVHQSARQQRERGWSSMSSSSSSSSSSIKVSKTGKSSGTLCFLSSRRRFSSTMTVARAAGGDDDDDKKNNSTNDSDDDASSGKSDFDNGSGFENADDWINNWKAGNFPRAKGWKYGDPSNAGTGTFTEAVADAPALNQFQDAVPGGGGGGGAEDDDKVEENRENMYGGDPSAYAYIFCHNLLGPPQDSFACMYLRDTLGAVGVHLITPDLAGGNTRGVHYGQTVRREGGEGGEGGGGGAEDAAEDFTVTSAVAALEAAVAAVPADKRPVRIIGSSLGAYVAALYASKPENHRDVDRVMLLAPTFNLDESVMRSLELELGITLSEAFKADAKTHPPFPFLRCRAYVVHGYDDEAVPLENSLTWVRDASVNMRAGTKENDGEVVAERRLLEVSGMGHGIENALPQIKARLIDFFKLPFVLPEGLE